jgi:signal transduction histidine kinase/ActR/RegA family two-component response regulator/sensor domain CHASE-containing protein
MFRRIQTQILLLLSVIAALSVVVILAYRTEQSEQLQLLFRDREAAKDSLLKVAVNVVAKSTRVMAYDYSQWDETVDFVHSPDTAWANENIDVGLKTYESQAAWALDSNLRIVYAVNTLEDSALNEFPIPLAAIRSLLRQSAFQHFFANGSAGIIECRTAPIQPSADDDRVTPPQGYLVIGRLWDEAFLEELNILTASTTRVYDLPAMRPQNVETGPIPEKIVNYYQLVGWDGSPLAEICATSEFTIGPAFAGFMRRVLWGTIITSILMLGAVTAFLLRRVSRPLTMISGALRDSDADRLGPMEESYTEFGTIARLIRQFFEQRDRLRQEIGQRERAELEVRRSMSLLEATLDSTADGILVVNGAGKVTSCNNRFVEMWRIPPELIQHRDDNRLLDYVLSQLQQPQEFITGVERLYANPDETSFDVLTFIDGRVFERYSQAQKVGPEIVGRVWSFRDVTKQRTYETERNLLESQLRRSQKLETIGTLAGGVAHDFNNILMPILGYADMTLMQLAADSPTRANIESISRAALRARDLVKQILAFSRQIEQEHRPMLVQLIIREALKLLRASIPSTVEIEQDLDGEVAPVNCDPTQIHQVMMNLGTNAAHAMRQNGGVLTVRLTRLDVDTKTEVAGVKLPNGTYVHLAVTDSGEGMDAMTLERVFEPFFTTKKPGEGTGLGLSVAHGIVKSHSGQIHVTSTPGIGTTIDVYLPCTEAQIEVPDFKVSSPLVGSGTVLVVDDEPENVSMVEEMLDYLGYKVVACGSAAEALAEFKKGPRRFDVVVTDQTMPHMTGAQLGAELLAIRPDLPIVLATGFSEVVSQKNYRRYGFREIIMKPILARDLNEAIQRCMASTRTVS